MHKISVNSHIKYNVLIDKGILYNTGELIYQELYSGHDPKDVKILVLLNGDLEKLSQGLLESLSKIGFKVEVLELPVGESSKNYYVLTHILDKLIESDFSRNDCVVAFGGGSIGDVAGFAASIYKRGVKLVQIPTTLLAMVDSAIGGKTAINFNDTKNVIGSFYQPNLVIEDTAVLSSIVGKNLLSGIGEIVKYGIIDEKIFEKLKTPINVENIEELIADCVQVKASFVELDEYDEGARHILNLGHTIGHAIESLTSFKTPHGIAVATGILTIAKCMDKAYGTSVFSEIKSILDIQGIDTNITIIEDDIIRYILKDKKWEYGALSLIVFDDIGKCRVQKFTKEELLVFLKNAFDEN